MARRLFKVLATLEATRRCTAQELLVSAPGQISKIPNWDIQSSSDVNDDLTILSQPGADTSSFYHIPTSRCTLMGCLLEAGIYKDEELWFSNNLESFNWGQFSVPWIYRNEFALEPSDGQHFILQTNGISSRADIYLNGELLADKEYQSGAYSGRIYEITDLVAAENALLIQAYPTNYFYDLALGFVDWNPYPPDNGTGVWRDVTVKQTGPVFFETLSAIVGIDPGSVTLRLGVRNLESTEVRFVAKASITEPDDGAEHILKETVTLNPHEARVIEFTQTFEDPKLWWPKQWGDQPLYSAVVTGSVNCATTDTLKTTFGLRTVTSEVNEDDDIVFYVNGKPFQVMGGGYSADMFLRFDPQRFEHIVEYMLDMGLNTIRLEGKNEHPELYDVADRMGLMVMAGWECCNKWESWSYNNELSVDPVPVWEDEDYSDANATMWHEARMLQTHPSMLTFLIGSDFWPDDRATAIYVAALRGSDWQLPIVPAASKRGYPDLLGRSGMKMEGPYDWVPPNYWYDVEGDDDRAGAAFGFGSELGAGVGTPELGSLRRFLSEDDMDDLWLNPDKGLYHMSTNVSQFYDRGIYNEGLYERYGAPTSLEDYLMKAQVADYEAIRAQHEAFSSRWSEGRIATGMIYWMLVNAWPSLHWNQFDYYLHPAGTYFGSKVGSRTEHVSYNYMSKDVWIINRSLDRNGARRVDVSVIGLDGQQLANATYDVETAANSAARVGVVPGLEDADNVVFVKLVLKGGEDEILSRNVYWIAPSIDTLAWEDSTWYHTPVTEFANYTSLFGLEEASIQATVSADARDGELYRITLENEATVPAFFIRMNLVDGEGRDVNPVIWSDNYLTLWPGERLEVTVRPGLESPTGYAVVIDGVNLPASNLDLGS
ncbi:glycoside hydrolase family 2 protein [Stachybotrys elegans]|uniref:Glycoside hydrolase family 2 protein n=1 Tax=Stachybotrys elegans TaxID=80388 RepID=A0A8K0SJX9_9HYPO|nr:glycoside hydrolase family 2 protein [Stachybotrys elegans]